MRRILPGVLVVLALLIDTSVVPALVAHWAVPMLTLVTVSVLGLLLGRTRGLLYGMIGGLLLDISVGGAFGLYTALMLLTGYLSGVAGRKFQRYLLTVVLAPAACFFIFEAAMVVFVFMAGQDVDGEALRNAMARVFIETVLAQFMYLLYNRLLRPKWSRYAGR